MHPRLGTNHSPFRYSKPGPWLSHHIAQARGPGTGSQEPRALDHRARTHVLPAVGCEVAERNLEVMIWSTLWISVAKWAVLDANDQLNGNDKQAQHYAYYGY